MSHTAELRKLVENINKEYTDFEKTMPAWAKKMATPPSKKADIQKLQEELKKLNDTLHPDSKKKMLDRVDDMLAVVGNSVVRLEKALAVLKGA